MGFQEFCGDTIFNKRLLLDSEWPHFSDCFQNSLLVWVPCGWLWLSLVFYLYYLFNKHQGIPIGINKLNISKTVPTKNVKLLATITVSYSSVQCLCVAVATVIVEYDARSPQVTAGMFISLVLALLTVIDVIKKQSDADDQSDPVYDVIYVSAIIKASSYMLAAILMQIERSKGVITSGVLWLFWFSSVVANIIPFYSKIYLQEYDSKLFLFVLFYITYGFLLAQLILSSFAEDLYRPGYSPIGPEPCPELAASFPNRLTYWWVNSLVLLAYRKGLRENNVFDLHPRDKAANVFRKFHKFWTTEVSTKRHNNRIREAQAAGKGQSDLTSFYQPSGKGGNDRTHIQADELSPLLMKKDASADGKIDKQKERSKSDPSLFKVLVKTYGFDLFKSHLCKFVYDLLQFVSPLLLNVLIDYTHNVRTNEQQGGEWKGYVYASSFFVVASLGSILFHQNFHLGMTLGMRIKSALISAVYKKSLTISNEAKKQSTVGEIVNLMSVDCQRMQDVISYLWATWSAPFQILLAMLLLENIMGGSMLAGLAIMLLLIPINAFIQSLNRKYQYAQMKFKDERIKLMSEVLNGIKLLKLYAWEPSFQQKVTDIRNKELHILRKSANLNVFSVTIWNFAPFVVTLATFATYVTVSDKNLDASKAFVALSLFNIIKAPISMLPMILSRIIQANVSLTRIGNFLCQDDLDFNNVTFDPKSADAVSIQNGTFTWDTSNPSPTLSNINLVIPEGKLVAVVGQVGAGKSSLLSAMLGEMQKLRGTVTVKSSIAYVPQQAWIQNATLKDNILFGKPENKRVYQSVVEACALRPDLDMLPGADLTEIGEKGINLSGGQKQRVSLARAVYSEADFYLLDDPLSAVDTHVGQHIFEKVISGRGLLRKKTRVLVTHGAHWLPMVDSIVVMTSGRISEAGTYEELLSHDGEFAKFLKTYLLQDIEENEDEGDEEDEEIKAIKAQMLHRVEMVTSDTCTSGDERQRSRKSSVNKSLSRQLSKSVKKDEEVKPKDKLIEEEKSETGQVKMSVFWQYISAIGVWATIAFVIFYICYQGANVVSSIWLSEWTSDDVLQNESLASSSDATDRNYKYLGVYGLLGLAQVVFLVFYAIILTLRTVRAAGVLHRGMLTNVLRSPMAFFDTTPSGRVLNRFSRDVEVVDNLLPQSLRSWTIQLFSALSTLIIISYSTPVFMVVIVPLGLFYFLVQRFYIPTSRQLKRIESTTRSPIYSHFSETITGVASIRAYKAGDRFMTESEDKVDKNLRFYFASIASNRWLGTRLEFIGNLLVLSAAMFAVTSDDLDESLVGLSVSYALQVTGTLNWWVRMTSELETNIVSVERIKEYTESETEAAWTNVLKKPEMSWPNHGTVQFVNYTTRYRHGLDLVLKGISCHIEGGEKIGIVGRTGAGKSSLTLALFRLIEAASGSILIDNINISHLGLHDLRSKITVLPQDPVLFSGSLRMNLDPFDQFSDDHIWQALEHAHLKAFAQEVQGGLRYECGEGGQNLSVGQRQLVCLARSLLRKTRILVLDEATAAVDMETDDLIQNTIRTEFKECTVLTIAHRLNTIMDYDRIMVLEQGLIKELDSPSALLDDKSSLFYAMAKDANLV